MPRPHLDVTTVRINVYREDRETMIQRFGYGWTSQVRELLNDYCRNLRKESTDGERAS